MCQCCTRLWQHLIICVLFCRRTATYCCIFICFATVQTFKQSLHWKSVNLSFNSTLQVIKLPVSNIFISARLTVWLFSYCKLLFSASDYHLHICWYLFTCLFIPVQGRSSCLLLIWIGPEAWKAGCWERWRKTVYIRACLCARVSPIVSEQFGSWMLHTEWLGIDRGIKWQLSQLPCFLSAGCNFHANVGPVIGRRKTPATAVVSVTLFYKLRLKVPQVASLVL